MLKKNKNNLFEISKRRCIYGEIKITFENFPYYHIHNHTQRDLLEKIKFCNELNTTICAIPETPFKIGLFLVERYSAEKLKFPALK